LAVRMRKETESCKRCSIGTTAPDEPISLNEKRSRKGWMILALHKLSISLSPSLSKLLNYIIGLRSPLPRALSFVELKRGDSGIDFTTLESYGTGVK
jgi:hypothetical protein